MDAEYCWMVLTHDTLTHIVTIDHGVSQFQAKLPLDTDCSPAGYSSTYGLWNNNNNKNKNNDNNDNNNNNNNNNNNDNNNNNNNNKIKNKLIKWNKIKIK